MGYIKEKKLTKHVCQPGKSSLQTGILPGFWILSTSLPKRVVELKFMVTLSCFNVRFQFYTFFSVLQGWVVSPAANPNLEDQGTVLSGPSPAGHSGMVEGYSYGDRKGSHFEFDLFI